MMWLLLFALGLSLMIYSMLSYHQAALQPGKKPAGYRVLRLREKSKSWATSPKWEELQAWYRRAGFSLTFGEVLFFLLAAALAIEVVLTLLALFSHKAFLLVGIILPLLILWAAYYYIEYRIDRRKRILLSDFIHCFSRLADFVYYKQISDYEKVRRSLVGTRLLHQALVEEVYFCNNPRQAITQMEQWVAFEEERIMLRNALLDALYSFPEVAEKRLLDMVEDLRKRKETGWKRELQKVEFLAMLAPRAGVALFALLLILPMFMVIAEMMNWR